MEKEKQTNDITVKEFKMWLEGVIEMQDEDWIPDARQWAKILGKIYDISDGVQVTPPKHHQVEESYSQFVPRIGIDNYPTTPLQYAASGLGHVAPVVQHNSALFANENGNVPTRTPNIDTSTGYDTPFV